MKNFSKYLDSVVEKALNEALESKADKIVSEIQKKMETTEKLHGKQSKLDVAEPKGKIDAEDFRLLRKKKQMKEYTMGDDDLEGVEGYGDFSTDSPKITPKGKKEVKNVGYKYAHKVAKEFNEEDVETTEGNEFSGELEKARKEGKKTFKVGNKTYPVKGESKEGRDKFDGRKSKVIGVYSNIDKQRMEEGQIDEKWKGDVDVKKTGQYSKMTIAQIDDEIKKLKEKNEKTKDKDLDKEIEETYIILRDNFVFTRLDIERFTISINKFLVKGIINELLVSSQDIINQIYTTDENAPA